MSGGGAGGRLVYFAPDITDAKVFARARAWAGRDLTTVAFRRPRYTTGERPHWPHIDLGEAGDRAYGVRAKALRTVLKIPGGGPAVTVARNLDMALLALAWRRRRGVTGPFVYEVLDVRRPMVAGKAAPALRWLERRVLARADRLWVSAPGFVDRYFAGQGRTDRWDLLENKLVGPAPPVPPTPPRDRWVIGWFGTLRCRRSLEVLTGLARAHPDAVEIRLRGYPARIGKDAFDAAIQGLPNVRYGGTYGPQDMPEMHRDLHFVWGVDWSDDWGNSNWLWPNRLYEAGYYGVPMLTYDGQATAARVAEEGTGWVLTNDPLLALEDLLEGLDIHAWGARAEAVRALPRSRFEGTEAAALLDAIWPG